MAARKLRCAMTETTSGRWKARRAVSDDLKWLLDRADKLASDRNNAIHGAMLTLPSGRRHIRGDGGGSIGERW